jgi:hypothetical protein
MDDNGEILRRLHESGIAGGLSWNGSIGVDCWRWAIGNGESTISGASWTSAAALCALGELAYAEFPTSDFASWWRERRSAVAIG